MISVIQNKPLIVSVFFSNTVELNYERMEKSLLSQYKDHDFQTSFNFRIIENEKNDFRMLRNLFYDTARELFNKFTIHPSHKIESWALVSNQNTPNKYSIHNHLKTASINGVFYLAMPELIEPEGNIEFLFDNKRICYKPTRGELLIFPGDLNHVPYPHSLAKFRISINMEIKTNESIEEVFAVENIKKKNFNI